MLSRRVRAFLYQLPRIAVQSDSQLLGNGFTFGNQIIEQLTGWREPCGGTVVQKRKRADGIGGGIEDELGPLRSTRVGKSDCVHAGASDEAGKFFDSFHRSFGRLEGTDPGVALDVEANVSGRDGVACGKSCAPNYELHLFGDDFFVTHAVLYGANRAVVVEDVRGLGNGIPSVDRLGRDNAKVAARKFAGVSGGI